MSWRATIVIPLLRQKDAWLEQAVRSAAGQTAACEVIVVISRETPQSNRDILSRLASVHDNLRVVFRDLPRGFPSTVNFGIHAAGTSRIGLLLSDDWLEPDCVAECLAHTADIVCASHTAYRADGITLVEGATRRLSMQGFLARPTLESKASYLTHFFLLRKNALERAGYLDESIGDFPGIDDYDLIWTMLEQHASVAIVEKCLYNYRDHDGERLTMADPVQAARNLGTILHKHGVVEPEFSRLMAAHGRWFGKPLYAVLAERRQEAHV
jgi:glycosyltransferase involved in cell wall biosynthesis